MNFNIHYCYILVSIYIYYYDGFINVLSCHMSFSATVMEKNFRIKNYIGLSAGFS